jgi:hypothetical protein
VDYLVQSRTRASQHGAVCLCIPFPIVVNQSQAGLPVFLHVLGRSSQPTGGFRQLQLGV